MATPTRPLSLAERFRLEIAHHALLLFITAAYCIAVTGYLAAKGLLHMPLFSEYLIAMTIPVAAIAMFRLFGETAYHALHVRPFQWTGLWQGIRHSEIASPQRALAALIPIVLLPFFSSAFTAFKVAIPQLAPFTWDPLLMQLDLTLHGGVQPWEALQPVLGHPVLTSAISYLYNLWQGLLLIVYWQMFRLKDRERRMQFLLAFVLAWIVLGSGGAYVFSSAGPCFYGNVVDGSNPYGPMMTYLHDAHGQYQNWGIIAQDYLWQIYQNGQAHLGGGISAMPSLHVAVALLVFLLMRPYGPRIAGLFGAYVVVIVVGSVHLGWHYAVDGYVGLAGGWLAWRVAGWLTRRVVAPAPVV